MLAIAKEQEEQHHSYSVLHNVNTPELNTTTRISAIATPTRVILLISSSEDGLCILFSFFLSTSIILNEEGVMRYNETRISF